MRLVSLRRAVRTPGHAVAPGERVLASAVTPAGGWVVGTERALYVAAEGGEAAEGDEADRHAWESIDRAGWDRDTSELTIVGVAEPTETAPELRVGLVDAGLLLGLVRERVTASVLVRRRVEVRDGLGLTAVARRSPTRTGDVTVSYVLDGGLDAGDPAILRAADQVTDNLRAELNL